MVDRSVLKSAKLMTLWKNGYARESRDAELPNLVFRLVSSI